VYFCCLEALQNVAKHAAGARSVSIAIVDDGELRFEVRTTARFRACGTGHRLTNMKTGAASEGSSRSARAGAVCRSRQDPSPACGRGR
jgi:hypothetical protein